MGRYILRRMIQMIPVLFLVSIVVFSIIHLIPGDPAVAMAGEEATDDQIAAVRQRLGLDEPVPIQYGRWAINAVRGDLGSSLRTRENVSSMIASRLPVTIQIALFSMFIALIIAVPIGVLAALRRNSPLDSLATTFAIAGVSIPNFFLAVLLIFVFSVQLRWLSPIGYTPFLDDPVDNLKRMIMPAITLGTALAAIIMRMTRSSLLEVLERDYVRTARAKGLSSASVIRIHALRNALIPVVTVVGLQIGSLLGGAIITETIFALPGIGRLLIDSIYQRDYPVVQGVILFIAFAFLVVNLIVDVMYAYLDPRIRFT